MSDVVLVISLWAMLGIFCLMVRNNRVFHYRNYLIEEMFRAGRDDIAHGRDPSWRREVFYSVSYNEMVYKFWKPLSEFYEDKSFIVLGAKPEEK